MVASLVQSAASASGGTAVLGSAPTAGNLLVAMKWRRGSNPTGIGGWTQIAANGSDPRIWFGNKVVSGDGTNYAADSAGRIVVMEWAGIDPCDNFATGGPPNTNVLAVDPPGSGQAIGGYFVYTDMGSRLVHVVSPSTLLSENWATTLGPWGSIGYGAGADPDKLSVQATSGAISFHVDLYWVGNFPLKTAPAATARSQGVVLF